MQLKCITGPCDGMHVEVPSNLRQHDVWQIHNHKEIFYKLDIELYDDITIPIHTYRVELLCKDNKQLKFLIPTGTDVWNVLTEILHGK